MFSPFLFLCRPQVILAVSLAIGLIGQEPCQAGNEEEALIAAKQAAYEAIDVSLFSDSIHHWQMKDGRDRTDRRFQENQIVEIAENLLKFQNQDGGWPANLDWLADIEVAEIRKIRNGNLGRSTFDNRNIYPQIDYLAQVFQATGLIRYQAAAIRGLEYVLQVQRPSGGWRGNDVDAITFNDDVMIGIMNLLLKIRQKEPNYQWLEPALRARLVASLDDAIKATLSCQIEVDGKKTAWCQQHDHVTFKPVQARSYELPSLTAQESVGVVDFLMKLPDPSPEVIEAIDGAVAWFGTAKIYNTRVKTVPIEPVRFDGFTAKIDRQVVKDKNASPIWARYYEIDTNRPFFCNRDGKKVYQLSAVKLERRVGYGWYGYWPAALISQRYPAWKLRFPNETDE